MPGAGAGVLSCRGGCFCVSLGFAWIAVERSPQLSCSLGRLVGFDVARISSSSADSRFDLRTGSSVFRPGVEKDILFRLFLTGSALSSTSLRGTFGGELGARGALLKGASLTVTVLDVEVRGFRFLTRVNMKPSSSSS